MQTACEAKKEEGVLKSRANPAPVPSPSASEDNPLMIRFGSDRLGGSIFFIIRSIEAVNFSLVPTQVSLSNSQVTKCSFFKS